MGLSDHHDPGYSVGRKFVKDDVDNCRVCVPCGLCQGRARPVDVIEMFSGTFVQVENDLSPDRSARRRCDAQ